jgi:hypothetical protein
LQTTPADIRAGWRYFRAWEKRFRLSARSPARSRNDLIYLAEPIEIVASDDLYEISDFEAEREQKIAFMKAYLCVVALETHKFEAYVRKILSYQSRLLAPRSLGFWFSQSQLEKFGAGASPFFQGEQVGIFCASYKEIDFADISAILPYDRIMVRNPERKWTKTAAQKLLNHIKWDLVFDGMETELKSDISWDFLHIEVLSPDYGIGKA